MISNFEKFRSLHQQGGLLVLPNAWDAKSALLFQQNNFPAVATSSAAVASSLGYEDGEQMPFDDHLFVIKRILSSIQIPLTVDMEMGYGSTGEEVYANMRRLAALGVAGINIEDSCITAQGRVLKDAKVFAQTIEYVKSRLLKENRQLFINIRCDSYILNIDNKQQETAKRLKMYEAAGADGIFLPCICAQDDIAEAVNNTKLPLNVMCVPGLPAFDVLVKLGVKRASMGPFLCNNIYNNITALCTAVAESRSFAPILNS